MQADTAATAIAHFAGGGSFESEVSDTPLWPSGAKVSAEELNDYLGNL